MIAVVVILQVFFVNKWIISDPVIFSDIKWTGYMHIHFTFKISQISDSHTCIMIFMIFAVMYQNVGRRSNVGMARMKSHVIRVQKASKLDQKA